MTSAAASLRVREFLLGAGFTADGVLARIGSDAYGALGRGLTVPTRRALAGAPGVAAPIDALVALFLLNDSIRDDALPGDVVADLAALHLVGREGDRLHAVVAVRPYGQPDSDWYLVHDLGAPLQPDHVLGPGGASLTLARITPRADAGRALDLGCGSGVQVLHAARHARAVTATDTNPRALALTALSLALSGIPADQVDLREGSLYGPVGEDRFDLIVSNPPFVISPSHRFTYRDAGLAGDELSRLVVRGAAAHLAPGGTAVVLVNWLHVTGQPWVDRVAGWVADTGVSAWIVARDAQAVADYAATWLRDAGIAEGADFDAALDEWLDAFADESCQAVGFGWVVLTKPRDPSGTAWLVVEDLTHADRLPVGVEVSAYLEGCADVEGWTAPRLLAARARLVDGATVTATTLFGAGVPVDAPPQIGLAGVIGPAGWRPAVPVPAAVVTALRDDPALPIGERLDAAAAADHLDPLDLLPVALIALRELVRLGVVVLD